MPDDSKALPTAYPLQWPVGWKRTLWSQRAPGMFAYRAEASGPGNYRGMKDITVEQACQRLLAELKRMGARDKDIIISTNLTLRLDGLPRSGQSQPGDPGAAVYWRDTKTGQHRCIAIDCYARVAQNIAALAATIEAMRAIKRHGGATVLERAFTGFTALPAPIIATSKKPWREVLQYGNSRADAESIGQHYRILASTAHPDKGGSDAQMAELNAARDEALREAEHG